MILLDLYKEMRFFLAEKLYSKCVMHHVCLFKNQKEFILVKEIMSEKQALNPRVICKLNCHKEFTKIVLKITGGQIIKLMSVGF
jgi:hypothetical protein